MKLYRKVYYLNYPLYKVPMIRLAGKFLEHIGIHVGDRIKVEYTANQILITKQNPSERKEEP